MRTCRSGRRQRMTRIAITVEAYEVIAAPPFGIVARVPPPGGRPESNSPGSAQHAERGKGPYVFPGGRPRQPLSVMAMTIAMPGLGAGDFTVHGMRSAARSWMSAPRTRIILRGGTPAVRPPLLRSPASKPHGSLMRQLRRAVGADPSLKRQAKPDRRSASRRARAIPFVPKKTVEQQDIRALHRARQRGGREGTLFVRNNPAIRGLVGWRAYMCAPARARRTYAPRPSGLGAFFACRGLSFLKARRNR
jgi:hypothetical protein